MAGTRRADRRAMSQFITRFRAIAEGEPNRKAWCSGCGRTYDKVHEMHNHRRTFRCGGRFMSAEERVEKGLPIV